MAIDNIPYELIRSSPRGIQIASDEPRFAQRFWSKVVLTANDEKCWEWQASTYTNGYGRIWVDGMVRLAHRVAWKMTHGEYAKLLVLHSCDNRKCVNPKHLREGTSVENTQDMADRGRRNDAVGERASNAKLTESQVREIRYLASNGHNQRLLAEKFHIGLRMVGAIYHRESWKHVI